MNPYISFDFDWTLYDPEKDQPIYETSALVKKLVADKANVCITTLRGENEIGRIKELFQDIPIFATNGLNKVFCLRKYIPVPIAHHYDDDLGTCIALLETNIKPIWVRNEKLREGIKKLKIFEI